MTIEEIKEELDKRGITSKAFAEQLGIGYSTLRLILSGRNPLTEQLGRHIELLLGRRKEQVILYKVTLPDEVAERWVPGFEQLTPEERQAAMKTVLMDAAAQLQAEGERTLTVEEQSRLRKLAGL